MKRIIAFLLCGLLLVGLTACGNAETGAGSEAPAEAAVSTADEAASAPASETEPASAAEAPAGADEATAGDAGLYLLYAVEPDDITHDEIEQLRSILDCEYGYLLLNEDGSAVLCFDDQCNSALTWEEGFVSAGEEQIPYTIEDGLLRLEKGNGEYFVFEPTDKALEDIKTLADDVSEDSGADNEPEAGNAEVSYMQQDPQQDSGFVYKYHVEMTGAEEFTDENGNPALRCYFDFYNDSEGIASMGMKLEAVAEQDGNTLSNAYSPSSETPDAYQNCWKNIEPGVTIRCAYQYAYDPNGGPVTFTVQYYSYDAGMVLESVYTEYTPGQLPGGPGDLAVEEIAEPTYAAGRAEEGYFKGVYRVTDISCEPGENFSGDRLLRVIYNVTNESGEPMIPQIDCAPEVFQNGVAMQSKSGVMTDSDTAFMNEVADGETVTVSKCYLLTGDTPVEVVFFDSEKDVFSMGKVLTVPAA